MATVGRGADQYTVRFPDGLRDRIKSSAEANNRSMNAEIVATLEEKYPAPKAILPSDVIDLMVKFLDAEDDTKRDGLFEDIKERLYNAGIPSSDASIWMMLGARAATSSDTSTRDLVSHLWGIANGKGGN